MKKYAYCRVSSKDQNLDRQLAALESWQVPEGNIYCDRQSGKDFERPAYLRLMRRLRPGDQLIIKSIDRLGRNYEEILEQWRVLTKEKQVNIVILDMPLLNTEGDRDLAGTLIADIVLQLLSYVAETEREFIRQRQAEGIAIAKQNGVRFGRAPLKRPPEYEAMKAAWEQKKISARAAAQELGITHRTFLKWVREETAEPPGETPGIKEANMK
ncbi:MAG: recombinase family protein [Lachnospiraceae bacterium]|nr:recombinase family protein [Lachnospiraceae bacterium]